MTISNQKKLRRPACSGKKRVNTLMIQERGTSLWEEKRRPVAGRKKRGSSATARRPHPAGHSKESKPAEREERREKEKGPAKERKKKNRHVNFGRMSLVVAEGSEEGIRRRS